MIQNGLEEKTLPEDISQPGPGTRLPIITGWQAYPGYVRYWYKDVASNAEQLKIYDQIPRPNGYFFLLPDALEKLPDSAQRVIATLCRTGQDTISSGHPSISYIGVKRVRIKLTRETSLAEGEWIAAVKDIVPRDIEQRVLRTKRLFARWVDSESWSISQRRLIEDVSDPVDFSHALANALILRLPKNINAQAMQTADAGIRLALLEEWMEAEISQDPVKSLIARFEQLDIPPDVRSKFDMELSLLKSSTVGSKEREHIIEYLRFAAALPWGDRTRPPDTAIAEARTILAKEHAGLEHVKQVVIDQLASLLWWKQLYNQAPPEAQPAQPPLRNLLLVGPPGTGKTTFLTSLARALDRRVEIIPCGGMSDIIALGGFERGYIGARVGAIMEAVMRAKTSNLVLGLDEIDKMGTSHRGSPYGVLLELTDPVRNTQFTDRYLQFPFDLSQVLVVATANTLDPIPSSLLDRFDILELRGYSLHEKLHMARSYVLPRLYKSLALSGKQISITTPALTRIIEEYTYESGVRGLTRTLLTLLQRLVAELLTNPSHKRVGPAQVRQYLGTPAVLHNQTPLKGGPGYSTILAVAGDTGMGIVNGLQVSLIKGGSGRCLFSGADDTVAKESAQIAVSFLKLHAEELEIDATLLSTHDIHIHYDEIAHRKKGPSAGVALLLAIMSALRQVALPEKWAVTGESTLDGRVLVVGGLAEKLVAAHRAGITTVLIPSGNQAQVADIAEDIRAELTIIPVATIREAIAHALSPVSSMRHEFLKEVYQVSYDSEKAPDEYTAKPTRRRTSARSGGKKAS
jgi:ATP-dependent Lon protease